MPDEDDGDEEREDVRVEVVNVDYEMRAPLPAGVLHGLPSSPCYLQARRVPVVRVFGATPAGQKALVHIHGLFPYFYFRAENDPAFENAEQLRRLLPFVAVELEKANSVTQQQHKATNAAATEQDKIVAKLLIVQGTPFYGYHPKPKLFIQIFLYNPRAVGKVVQLLESGCITDRRFQVYEAHIPFLLQVFADKNIEGMNYLHLSNVKFRAPVPTAQAHLVYANNSLNDGSQIVVRSNIPDEKVSGLRHAQHEVIEGRYVKASNKPNAHWFERQSTCALEIDVAVDCILNTKLFNDMQNASSDTSELRTVPSLAALWKEERLRRIHNGESSAIDFTLSVDRHAVGLVEPPSSAHSASSLMSQSFFHQRMKESLDQVLTEMKKHAIPNAPELDISIDDDSFEIDNVGSASEHTSISTDSAFAFSQVERTDTHEISNEPQKTISQEDQEIMDILIAMQKTSQPEWQEQVSMLFSQSESKVNGQDQDAEHQHDIDEDYGNSDDEIGDILASQMAVESPNSNSTTPKSDSDAKNNDEKTPWWYVAETEESISSSNPLSELGSARILSQGKANHTKKEKSARQLHDEFETSTHNVLPPNEIENLNESRLLTLPAEDSSPAEAFPYPDDPLQLSLTQQVAKIATTNPFRATSGRILTFEAAPPTIDELVASSLELGIGAISYKAAYFGNQNDIPDSAMVFGGQKFQFTAQDLAHTAAFDTLPLRRQWNREGGDGASVAWTKLAQLKPNLNAQTQSGAKVRRVRIPAKSPPDAGDVKKWLASERQEAKKKSRKRARQVVLSASMDSRRQSAANISNVTLLSLEVHACSRGTLLPDPIHDKVDLICYAIEAQEGQTEVKNKEKGFLILASEEDALSNSAGFCVESSQVKVRVASDERHLFRLLVELVQRWDPDFLTGFEVQKASIGYLVDRAAQLDMNLIQALSRLPSIIIDARNPLAHRPDEDGEEQGGESIGTTWGMNKASGLWIHGRYVLNLWRMSRSEVKLSCYTFESVVRATLKREVPVHTSEQLTKWYALHGTLRWKVIRYYLERASLNLQVINKMQLITRTSEMARLFGIDFYSVLSRGSQYRVEAVMLRVTKRFNYLLVSPSRSQVASQPPMECIPLVMEPHSSFYHDPVVVLDFQSLYPSLVIGYNLCYSTLLGRLKDGMNPELESILGVTDFKPSAEGFFACKDDLTMIPNGTIYCPKTHRVGVLPQILNEILSTRIMVKKALKNAKASGQDRLAKVLDARQLALKMIANVTYGYTAAGFSGRMPCAQLADAIVQSGRCTLEAAVKMVESRTDWNAKVVYGDTDSLFVLLRGRSKPDAFRIGQEIADAVTAANPKPVTLKLEKIYFGCVLVSKKRYVGNKFEHADQKHGVLESKGIEIVCRDSCGVVQTCMEKSLEQLFTTRNLSNVKRMLSEYWLQMLENRLPLRDFVFAKEVRLGTYSNGSCPPAALVSTKAMVKDSRAEPRYAERVPYVVVNGPPGARLIDLVVSPSELMDKKRSHHSINYQYYMHKQILPSLERIFLLVGVNVRSWYADLPRVATKARAHMFNQQPTTGRRNGGLFAEGRGIDAFYMSKHCRLCGSIGMNVLCDDCIRDPQRSLFSLQVTASHQERSLHALRRICQICGDRDSAETCINLTCSVWNQMQLIEIVALQYADLELVQHESHIYEAAQLQ